MTDDEAAIRKAIGAYTAAIRAKDAAGIIATYADDLALYDLAPPLMQASQAVRDAASLQQWFDTWDGPIQLDQGQIHIEAGNDLAATWSLCHLSGVKVGEGAQSLWFRSTIVLRRDGGAWKIAHIHESVPFAMDGSGKALLELTPEEQ